MPGWASGPCWSTGGPSYERATLAALCYPERAHSRDKTGQLCTNTHSSGLLHEAKSAPPLEKDTSRLPLQATYLPANSSPPSSNTDRLATSASVHSPWPPATLRNHHPCHVRADPAALKLYCEGGGQPIGSALRCSYCWGFCYSRVRRWRELWSPRTLAVY